MSDNDKSIPQSSILSSDNPCDCEPWNDVYCELHLPELEPDEPEPECSCAAFGHDCGKDNNNKPFKAPTPKQVEQFLGRPAYLPPPPKANQCPHQPKSKAALEWALDSLQIDVRQNMRWYTTDWRRNSGSFFDEWSEWTQMTGRAAARFRSDIEEAFVVRGWKDGLMPLKFGQNAFNESLDSMLFSREVDPFVEYLDDLRAPKGRHKLPIALAHCFDVDPEYLPLAEWASRTIFLGAVWRAYHPGTVLDEMPIIVGPGGIGKTSFLREAVPPELTGLYGSGLDLAETPKARVEALQGRVLVECSDMMGSTAGDANRIKDFISRTDDGSVRLAYRRDPEPSPRRCVLVGTANRDRFLRPDGNPRRFVPVRLTGGKAFKVIRFMETYRDRLWSEAKELYLKGQHPRLPDELKALAHDMAVRAFVQ